MRRITCIGWVLLSACTGELSRSDELSVQLTWTQAPGTEVQTCHVLRLENPEAIHIGRIAMDYGLGAHHVHVYRATTDDAPSDGAFECPTAVDWERWSLLFASQSAPLDWELPPETAIALTAEQPLLIQVHWLNTTAQPIAPQIGVRFYPRSGSPQILGTLLGINRDVTTAPRESRQTSLWCGVPAGATIVALMGHFHGFGTHYAADLLSEADASGERIYEATGESSLGFRVFDPPVDIPSDQGLRFTCSFFNSTTEPLTWGAQTHDNQEHCNLVAYYAPADRGTALCMTPRADEETPP